MGDDQDKNPNQLEIIEKNAFELKAEGKLLFALEKLEEAVQLDKRWYHFFYKAIWLYEFGKKPEAAEVLIYGLNLEKAKEFYFRYLSADFLYRAAWTQAQKIEEIDQSIKNMDQAIQELNTAEYLLLKNKKGIEDSRRNIRKEIKDLHPTFLNSEDLTYEVRGLRSKIEMMRHAVLTFQAIIQAESRVNTAIEENRSRISAERVRTIELLGIFTAIFAFIFSGVQLFTSVPLSEAVVLQGGMALIMVVFFLGVHLVTDKQARTKLLIGIFVILLILLVLFPFYARLARDPKGNNVLTTISNHNEITRKPM
ncbi:MAG: hypothetical protein JW804_03690 [Sedimentisphaerales bacterium]|nr:hypothetical protein [Sedimentisphaerales bacterium]